ncbi:YfhJ family protein [Bacillus sp. 165]|uniref:YfhJ family protein n=1 Tax=Bacillus sp. 165 TaxID=1529117 RepID=UPI001ADD0970|nr:YfhJ family protein [Bacillus sp. 165]MBO9130964.1 hypothetical protein [Bacillus sp. 165]
MNEALKRLTAKLLKKNEFLSYAQAQAWVELLWEDFEATYAKAGEYHGNEMTEAVVAKRIEQHGTHFHLVKTNNPKYSHLINSDDYLKH